MTALGRWLPVLAFLSLFLIHERQAAALDGPSRPETAAASAPVAPLRAQSLAIGGSLECPPDHSMPTAALADDRADTDENGHSLDDKDWKGSLHLGFRADRAGFDRMIRLPPSSAQAKWFHRAWGQP